MYEWMVKFIYLKLPLVEGIAISLKNPLLMIRHEIAIDICISRKRHVKNVDKCPFIHFKYAKSSIMIHLEIFTESILLS